MMATTHSGSMTSMFRQKPDMTSNSELWICFHRVQSAHQTFDPLRVARVCNGIQRSLCGQHSNVFVGTNNVQHFAMRDCKHAKITCAEEERQNNAKPLLSHMRNKPVLSSVAPHAPPQSQTWVCFCSVTCCLAQTYANKPTQTNQRSSAERRNHANARWTIRAFQKPHSKSSPIGCGPINSTHVTMLFASHGLSRKRWMRSTPPFD